MIHVRMCAHVYTCVYTCVPTCVMSAFAPLALRPYLWHCFYVCVELALDKVDCLIIKLMNTVELYSVELKTAS